MRETGRNGYKVRLVQQLRRRFPGCFILQGNSAVQQGIPDLIILWHNHWAMLEVKAQANSTRQPNQPYYVDMFNEMSFAAFIYPENEEEVLDALSQAFA